MLATVDERDGVVVIAVARDFRHADVRRLWRVVLRAGPSERCFVLDLSAADEVSEGSVILALLGVRNELRRRSARLVVVAEPEMARRLADDLRLDELIGIATTRDGAVEQAAEAARAQRLDRTFAAQPAQVAVAREHVACWLRATLPGEEALLSDVTLAVSEACTNAVLHAYPDGAAKGFRIVGRREGDIIEITVSDEGTGMTTRGDSPGMGLGLPLMSRVANGLEVRTAAVGRGTVVAMRFRGDAARQAR